MPLCLQVKALEKELLKRAEEQGIDIHPQIIVVTRHGPSHSTGPLCLVLGEVAARPVAIRRLIPEAQGTLCNQRIERIERTKWARILRVPFRRPDGSILPQWISRCTCRPRKPLSPLPDQFT